MTKSKWRLNSCSCFLSCAHTQQNCFRFIAMHVKYHSGKLAFRGWIPNLGVLYLMKALVKYFVDEPFCGEIPQRGQWPAKKVKIYLSTTIVKQRTSQLVKVVSQISTLKIFGLKVYKLRKKEQIFWV